MPKRPDAQVWEQSRTDTNDLALAPVDRAFIAWITGGRDGTDDYGDERLDGLMARILLDGSQPIQTPNPIILGELLDGGRDGFHDTSVAINLVTLYISVADNVVSVVVNVVQSRLIW